MSLWQSLWLGSLWRGVWQQPDSPPQPPISGWLLATGQWNDSGTWVDSEVWNDG